MSHRAFQRIIYDEVSDYIKAANYQFAFGLFVSSSLLGLVIMTLSLFCPNILHGFELGILISILVVNFLCEFALMFPNWFVFNQSLFKTIHIVVPNEALMAIAKSPLIEKSFKARLSNELSKNPNMKWSRFHKFVDEVYPLTSGPSREKVIQALDNA
ncbi:hypothetical protein ACI2KR_06570 [Pseudomonas luteola]